MGPEHSKVVVCFHSIFTQFSSFLASKCQKQRRIPTSQKESNLHTFSSLNRSEQTRRRRVSSFHSLNFRSNVEQIGERWTTTRKPPTSKCQRKIANDTKLR